MKTGQQLFNLTMAYKLRPRMILGFGLPDVLCYTVLRQMPPHHLEAFHKAVDRIFHDQPVPYQEFIDLNHMLNWYLSALANYPTHADHCHTVLQNTHRQGHR